MIHNPKYIRSNIDENRVINLKIFYYTFRKILGEYASAIETLVTAISLIKQSKVSSDDRCKIIISSLQDTLHGIETKSYGHSRRGKIRIRLFIF